MAFGFTILGVIVAAFILQHFGYLTHSSPLKMSVGGGRVLPPAGGKRTEIITAKTRFEI